MAVALVTGSAKGIGREFALALAEDGYDIVIHYLNSKDAAEETAKQAEAFGVKALVLQADITKVEEAQKLIKDTHSKLGGLDILVNNVGNYVFAPLDSFKLEDWHEMFDSNLHCTFYTCQEAVELMRHNSNGGRIINIGYAGSEKLVARPSIAAYGIAKTGVILYSKALAKTEAKNGITVNIISPGVIENSVSKPLEEIPMKRLGFMNEMVAAMRYFVSKEADYITGVTIEVAGGWNL